MSVFELAKRYYPRLWDIDRLSILVKIGRLSKEDFFELTGEEYKRGEEGDTQ